MRHGIVIGKFYPPHIGHHALIDFAMSECDKVTVAVCHSSVENIDYRDRMDWISESHEPQGEDGPEFEIIHVPDDSPVLYTDETWELWLDELMGALDWQGTLGYPNTIYSGEDYAPEFARRLLDRYSARVFQELFPQTVDVRMIDRAKLPVSASMFRLDPPQAWPLLRSAAKGGLAKRVVICGAESSGTTTLTKALAKEYDEPWVPEYGRVFTEAMGENHVWTPQDFFHIATTQRQWINDYARRTRRGLLLADTDQMATAMFSKYYLSEDIEEDLKNYAHELFNSKPADLYIVTDHRGVEFDDDGWRLNKADRVQMTEWFMENLPSDRTILVTGDPMTRKLASMDAIENILMNWGIEEPIEYRTS
jgi:HTH-type transcriptional repressor of NAD biosynthesis genes